MKILFCDWNGTLLDDTIIWEQAMGALFQVFGKKPPTIAEYFRALESGDYMEVYRKRGIDASREELNAMYEKEYVCRASSATIFPQVREVLQFLFRTRVTLALVTAQPQAIALPMLEQFGIDSLFSYLEFHALDKKVLISKIISNEIERRRFVRDWVSPHECYFIGDAPSDMRHAKQAGIQAVAFLNDHVPHDLVLATKPDHIVHSFQEITRFM
ncbi:MAG: HAD family hydrolase [Parcubacteria group bacterium]|nr:HAD family hydrolase [Parcubacteria group bacterium]